MKRDSPGLKELQYISGVSLRDPEISQHRFQLNLYKTIIMGIKTLIIFFHIFILAVLSSNNIILTSGIFKIVHVIYLLFVLIDFEKNN